MNSLRKLPLLLLIVICYSTGASAAEQLRLIPYPQRVEKGTGTFTVTSATRIVLSPKHAKEDRVAAEMLAEEVESAIGTKPKIVTGAAAGVNSIRVTRAGDASLKSKRLDSQSEEAYVLVADAQHVTVGGRGASGTFYGVQTLRQLLIPNGKKLQCPEVTITDWPTMQWRGVHYDLSRGPIPTLDYMKKVILTISEYKMNMFALYMEHVFDFPEQPIIAPKEAAITPAMVKELVAYGEKYHVTILPEQQTFGHLHHVLKYELYSDMAERPHGHVLAPVDPKSYEFIKSMYAQLVPLFPSPLFHIGGDETWELGHGQTKAHADQAGLGRVYLEHLSKVAELMRPYHKRLMFWGDIAMKYPDLLTILPKDVIAVAWKYDDRPSFDDQLQPYKNNGLDLFVAPGVNNWNDIYPNLSIGYVNIRNFVRDGQKFGALGMLNTTWMDDGEALFGMTWAPLVLGGACSWQKGECSLDQFADSYDWAFYRNADDHTFHDAIQKLNKPHDLLKSVGLRAADDASFWIDPFSQTWADYATKAQPVAHDLRMNVEQALDEIYKNRSKARLHADTIDPLIVAGYRLDLLGMKIQFTKEMGDFYAATIQSAAAGTRGRSELSEISGTNARLQDLRDATTRVRDLYSAEWLRENHPYWLGNVTVRFDNLAQTFQAKITEVRSINRQKLPSAEEIGFRQIGVTAPADQPMTPKQ